VESGAARSSFATLEFTGHKVLQFFSAEAACLIGLRGSFYGFAAAKKGSEEDETLAPTGLSSDADLSAVKLLSVSATTHRHASCVF
jgi:hypothetical protein